MLRLVSKVGNSEQGTTPMLEPAGKVVEGFQWSPTMLGLSLLGLPSLPEAPGHYSASPSSISFQLFSGQLSAGRNVPFHLLSPERTTEEEREGGAQGARRHKEGSDVTPNSFWS